jgi:hypothetical protein
LPCCSAANPNGADRADPATGRVRSGSPRPATPARGPDAGDGRRTGLGEPRYPSLGTCPPARRRSCPASATWGCHGAGRRRRRVHRTARQPQAPGPRVTRGFACRRGRPRGRRLSNPGSSDAGGLGDREHNADGSLARISTRRRSLSLAGQAGGRGRHRRRRRACARCRSSPSTAVITVTETARGPCLGDDRRRAVAAVLGGTRRRSSSSERRMAHRRCAATLTGGGVSGTRRPQRGTVASPSR